MNQNDRISKIIQEFDAQGWHRSGTEVDHLFARWLAQRGRELGLDLELESFQLNRVVPQNCFLEIEGRRIEGLPFFDGSFTSAEGISGHIGSAGSSAEIGLGKVVRASGPLGGEPNRDFQNFRGSGGHQALVAVTIGEKHGLMASNAPDFRQPFGPPVLQVSSEEREFLTGHAKRNSPVRLVASAERVGSESFNVTGLIKGSGQNLPPIVVMTPRSGWWHCASERGAGLACWLEVMRLVVQSRPHRAGIEPPAATNWACPESMIFWNGVPAWPKAHTPGSILGPTWERSPGSPPLTTILRRRPKPPCRTLE